MIENLKLFINEALVEIYSTEYEKGEKSCFYKIFNLSKKN